VLAREPRQNGGGGEDEGSTGGVRKDDEGKQERSATALKKGPAEGGKVNMGKYDSKSCLLGW